MAHVMSQGLIVTVSEHAGRSVTVSKRGGGGCTNDYMYIAPKLGTGKEGEIRERSWLCSEREYIICVDVTKIATRIIDTEKFRLKH
jgi:hypothetical protein